MRYGEIGTTFMIILDGLVGVELPFTAPKDEMDMNDSLEEIKTLSSGAAFGELALQFDKPRSATIV